MTLKNKGFTLIELSIVLIIVGLIVSGILAGEQLVKGAKLKHIMTDFRQFNTAIASFKNTYGQLPGDFNNAKAIWPVECTDQVNAACNGTGNGMIRTETGPNNMERIRAWQHLSLAGLIEGEWPGYNAALWTAMTAATNPSGPDSGTLYDVVWDGNALWGSNRNQNFINFGFITAATSPGGGALTGLQIYSIDKKLDDGFAQTGMITAKDGVPAPTIPCHDGTNYAGDDTEKSCRVTYRLSVQN
jgi:prepilin-type N-terminal cleavage/methylation domain-containing protein